MAIMELLRAHRFALDVTPVQVEVLQRYATAARCGFDFALGYMTAVHRVWERGRDRLVAEGMSRAEANKKAPRVQVPSAFQAQAWFREVKGQPFIGPLPEGEEGKEPFPWWEGVSSRAYYTAFDDASTAFRNWRASAAGQRAGARVGYPRFKRRGGRERFRLVHNVKKPEIRFTGPRRLRIPGGGGQAAFTVRLHQSARDLVRRISAGTAVITSVTVSREGHRWHASVLCRVEQSIPDRPTRRQVAAGRIGADLGVSTLATFSDPLTLHSHARAVEAVDNPRHLENTRRKLARAQRVMARRYVRGAAQQSKGYLEARDRVAKLHAQLSARRAHALHLISKRLVQQYAEVALETLNTKGMVASAKGTTERPGRNVRQKAGLNRGILDAAFGELNRQIEYKALSYGARIARVSTYFPSSKTCSGCGWINQEQTLKDRQFHCRDCGLVLDRDRNAARNIKANATSTGYGSKQTPGEGL
ncbi:RNA-guided endonuclease InsQ/TnpB family protein [Streptomyces sp. NBC_01276]|uniref:RNA-guided endonuclease InsQ/TnpB family protein n=1 Tax=Streptomyces sp. NBC_01276 TaxID=2903808 RepID=UPI00352E1082